MIDFILEYWMQVLFGSFVAVIGAMYRRIMNTLNEQHKMKAGMLALMQDRLYQGCTHYMQKGCIDIESMRNLDMLYENYNKLGGNGVASALYERIKSLPIEEEE